MDRSLTRIQYIILNILKKNKAIDHMHSMSCYEICEIEKTDKPATIYKHIRLMEKYGYVLKGARVGRANGYILSKNGINVLQSEYQEDNKNE